MKLPHQVNNFEELVTKGYYYVDKTPYILKFERIDRSFVIFLRPETFNRYLFISMLTSYYGIEHVKKFRRLFAKLYISQHPTPSANSFHVLKFDFSHIEATRKEKLSDLFVYSIKSGLDDFIKRYRGIAWFDKMRLLAGKSPGEMIRNFFKLCQSMNIFIIINEFHNFIDELLVHDPYNSDSFKLRTPFLNDFYATIRQACQTGIVKKTLVVGIDKACDRS